MEKTIDVSVVFPVYNVEKYLAVALDSLFSQKKIDFEVVAVDDGSTDSSSIILSKYKAIHKDKLIVITQQNRGLSAARNRALESCQGCFVTFVDSDDYLEPLALYQRVQEMKKKSLDLLITNAYRFSNLGGSDAQVLTPLLQRQPWDEVITGADWIKRATKANEWPHYVYMQTVRRAIIRGNFLRFKKGIVHEDILWTTQLALSCARVCFMNKADYGYRKNLDSITGDRSIENLTHRANSYLIIIKDLIDLAENVNEPDLEKALIWQATKETAHLSKIIRKKITNKRVRQQLVATFLAQEVVLKMFKKSKKYRARWRVLQACIPLFLIGLNLKIHRGNAGSH